MAESYVIYEPDGTVDVFAVPFPYLSKTHVKVLIDGSDTPYAWANASYIQIDPCPVLGSRVAVRRETPTDKAAIDFTDGSILSERDLDKQVLQLLYVAQETRDHVSGTISIDKDTGVYNAGNTRITGVAAPVLPTDAVNLQYLVTYLNQITNDITTSAEQSVAIRDELVEVQQVIQDIAAIIYQKALQVAADRTAVEDILQEVIAGHNEIEALFIQMDQTAGSILALGETASTSAAQAAASAQAAATSASTATTKAAAASASATTASTKATEAAASASTASAKAGEALVSATTATEKASEVNANTINVANNASEVRSIRDDLVTQGFHTHSNKAILDATQQAFTTTLKSKLDGIAAGAEVNVQADWNATSGDALILNKPVLGGAAAMGVQPDRMSGSSGVLALCGSYGFGMTALVYSGDLNDITVTSIYYCDGNSLNRPISINGWLETLVYATTGYAVQRYWANGTSWCSVRYQKGGVWGSWTSLGGDGFLVAKTTNQTLAAATLTKVTFDNEFIDDGAAFGNSTFTVKYAGRYLIGGQFLINNGVDSQTNYLYIKVNGSNVGYSYMKQVGASCFLSGQIIQELAVGNTVELFAQVGSAGDVASSAGTRFWGVRL